MYDTLKLQEKTLRSIKMAYSHLNIKELIWIEQYYKSGEKVINITKYLSRARQTIYNVINCLKKV